MYVMSHIPFAMPYFMRHAPSQSLTPNVMSYYSMSNLKLYVLCPMSMSSKVCHVPYSVSKAKIHVMSRIPCRKRRFMRHAASQCLTPYVMPHIPCEMPSLMHHAPSQCLTPYVMKCDALSVISHLTV